MIDDLGSEGFGDLNPNALPFTRDEVEGTVPARFRRVVGLVPPAHPAVVSGDERLTYAEVDALSDRLAAALVKLIGSARDGRQALVGVLLHNGLWPPLGMLGVLKAGHTYVPLDASLGLPMIRQVLADCRPQALVTVEELRSLAEEACRAVGGGAIVCLDALPLANREDIPDPLQDATAIQQVQYTSGSTGRPRGVMRIHRAALLTAWRARYELQCGLGSRLAQLLSYAFSMSNASIYGALLTGATLYPLTVRTLDARTLYDWLLREGITEAHMSVGAVRSLIQAATGRPRRAALRYLVTGGVAMTSEEISRVCEMLEPGGVFEIRLASTEAGAYGRFVARAGAGPLSGPLLYRVPDEVRVEIVDDDGRPVSEGQAGQIAVHHRYTVGYYNQPELTAEKYLPDPHDSSRRIYLTGDQGRFTPDGRLEYLGRKDSMVKVRGYRVELEAIETTLAEHAGVRECAVIAVSGREGNTRLVAYWVAGVEPAPTESALRAWMRQALPDYMVPSRFVALQTLPRTATDKIDRKALPVPGRERPMLGTPYVAPASALERELVEIWAEVLDLDQVGAQDDFMELGGDSLSALHMMLMVEERLERKVPAVWYGAPTLARLAELLEAAPIRGSAAPTEELLHPAIRSKREAGPGRWAIVHGGPVLGRFVLPYAFGNWLQRALFSWRPLQRRLLTQHRDAWTQSLAAAGLSDPDGRLLTQYLMINTWRGWRTAALRSEKTYARYVAIEGAEALQAAAQGGRGLLVVFVHQACSVALTRILLTRMGRNRFYTLSNAPRRSGQSEMERVMERTERVHKELLQGGVVFLGGDGRMGAVGLHVPFYGRLLPLRRGFAELAMRSNAAIVTVEAFLALDGKVTLNFAPLPTPRSSAEATVLVNAYAERLVAHWPRLLPNMPWARLSWLCEQPLVEGEAQSNA
jgi:acyl-coenzyme A synthetase/AMP-(fatty) acid ligase/acyl carrier protein